MGLPSLADGAARFAGLPLRTVTAAEHCCCVLQGEIAYVDLRSAPAAPALVGSGEATTCVVAIVVSARPARVCVAHFDASCLRQPAPAVAALEVRPGCQLLRCLLPPRRQLAHVKVPREAGRRLCGAVLGRRVPRRERARPRDARARARRLPPPPRDRPPAPGVRGRPELPGRQAALLRRGLRRRPQGRAARRAAPPAGPRARAAPRPAPQGAARRPAWLRLGACAAGSLVPGARPRAGGAPGAAVGAGAGRRGAGAGVQPGAHARRAAPGRPQPAAGRRVRARPGRA